MAPTSILGDRPRSRASLWVGVTTLVAFTLGGAFFLLTAALAFARHDAFNTGRYDLEIYTQVIWNTAHGRPFETTLLKTNLSHLAEHVALVLVPLAGLYRLFPDPKLLLGVQQLALALLGWPVFAWAHRALGSPWQALLVLACFYASPALAGVALDDFHAVPLAAVPVGVGFWLVLIGQFRVGALVSLLALPIEEEAALVVFGIGAFLWLTRQRWLGALVAGLAILWLATAVFVVMPRFHDPRTFGTIEGNRTLDHFSELRRDPLASLGRVFGPRGADAVLRLLLPTGGLAMLAPQALIPAFPSFAVLMLKDRDDTFGRHWVAPLLVVTWLAAAAGLARLSAGRPRRLGLALMTVGAVIAFVVASPLPAGGGFDAAGLRRGERVEELERAVDRVPPIGSVVASPNVVAHLANRAEAYVFPIDSHYAEELGWRRKRPDYYVLDLNDDLTTRAAASDRLNPLNADRPYAVWSSGRKVLVLSNSVDEPLVPLQAVYGRIRLLGYDLLGRENDRRLILHWDRTGEVRGRYDRDLTVYDRAGRQVLYEEDMPLSAVYGSNKWRDGQRILDEIALPNAAGPLRVRLAWVAQDKRRPILLPDRSEALEIVLPGPR